MNKIKLSAIFITLSFAITELATSNEPVVLKINENVNQASLSYVSAK